MPWLQLTLKTDAQHASQIETLLEEAGALAVSLADAADDPLYEPLPGTQPVWPQTCVIGLFEEFADPLAIIATLTQALDEPPGWQVQRVEDQAWERAWLDNFHPLSCGTRLWICPHGQQAPTPDAVTLWMDPGLAFGTGTHPTTALCLEWLDASLSAGATVIDYGCGSGILGLAALRLGAAQVFAVDNDPQALWATHDNAARNNIAAHSPESSDSTTSAPLWVGLPEQLPPVKVDLLLVNILSRIIIELAAHLAELVRPGGHIVLSGILTDQVPGVVAAFLPWFDFRPVTLRDGWACLSGVCRA